MIERIDTNMERKNSTILMISSGMKNKKKDFMNEDTENLYLNYGLLGLASLLYEKGFHGVRMFQGDFKEIGELLQEIHDDGIDVQSLEYPVFLSIPSFFALSWAQELIIRLKDKNPNIQIIVGGRWTVDNNLDWIKNKLPLADYISRGCPDDYIEELLDAKNWEKYQEPGVSKEIFTMLNYKLLYQYKQYQPSIEISRGCGNGCAFCLEGNYKQTKVKSPLEVIQETKAICNAYEDETLNFYFQASIFTPTLKWAKEFKEKYDEFQMKFKWRFETRVDHINPNVIEILAQAGLKVIDLGLESASVQQLERMEKTKNPSLYLQKARDLLEKAKAANVWCKLNVLLYAGETEETIQETLKWLKQNTFKGVSVNPFILYLNGKGTGTFVEKIKEITKMDVDMEKLYENGYLFIDLSNEISSEKAKEKTKQITEICMNKQDYWDLKNMGYTRRKGI